MLAGTISWLGGCALWATSVEYCRRRLFELFYKTHIIGLVTFFMFGYMHHVSLWAYTMPGVPANSVPHTRKIRLSPLMKSRTHSQCGVQPGTSLLRLICVQSFGVTLIFHQIQSTA